MKINEIQEGSDREYLDLPKEEIERLRAKFLPDWEYKDNSLQKRYKFEDYFEVIRFLINTIKPQEKLDHHADLGVFYDEVLVKITLTEQMMCLITTLWLLCRWTP